MMKPLTPLETSALISTLKKRFQAHPERHSALTWEPIEAKLSASLDLMSSLLAMESTGGEPDVIDHDPKTDRYLWVDCSEQSPAERRSLCYDRTALDGRKENKPRSSAIDMANDMGVQLLDETLYRKLQSLGAFDTKTSSWILTPESIRTLGGALFGDRRYDTVFFYHNGADSYYSARGFRTYLWL